MSIPNHVTALANHKGAAIVHAGGMLIPVKIMDISHEESYRGSATEFKCLVVDSSAIDLKTFVNHAMKPADGTVPGYLARRKENRFTIDHVLFNGPATIVFWKNGDKTIVVSRDGEMYDKETDLALCFTLRQLGLAKVIFEKPTTTATWEDGTETVVSCQEGDVWSKETGLFTVITKKTLGNKGNFNDVFKKHIPVVSEDVADTKGAKKTWSTKCRAAYVFENRIPVGREPDTVTEEADTKGAKKTVCII